MIIKNKFICEMINKINKRRGEKIYAAIKEKLEPTLNNKFVAIEVDSGDYFIGNDAIEATGKAKKKYPDSTFFLVRIGCLAAFKTKMEIMGIGTSLLKAKTLFIGFTAKGSFEKTMEELK